MDGRCGYSPAQAALNPAIQYEPLMKIRNLFGILALFCAAASLAGCNDTEDDRLLPPPPPDIPDTYLSPSVPRGKTVVVKENLRPTYLGAGYDIMGGYASNSALRLQVIDLRKVSPDRITSLNGMTSEQASFAAVGPRPLLDAIREEGKFVSPTGEKSHLLFTGTLTESRIALAPYDYSSQYAFVVEVSGNRLMRQTLQTLHLNWDACLSEEFKEALAYNTPDEIVKTFGTHLLVEAHIGTAVRTLYRSLVAAADDKAARYAATRGMEACRSTLLKSQVAAAEEAKKNYEESIALAFQGGDYATLPDVAIIPGEGILGGPIDLIPWLYSLKETNGALASLHGDDLIPLYDVVSDPRKKQQLREAIVRHILSRQLEEVATRPLFQATDGAHYRYAVSYSQLMQTADESFIHQGVLGSVYQTKGEGMTPLYRFSDGATDRLATSLRPEDTPSLERVETLGYVYAGWEKGTETLYEATNGRGFAYTPEKREAYGEEGKWKRTGKEIYLMRGAR